MSSEKKSLLEPDIDNSWKAYKPEVLDMYDKLVLQDSNDNAWMCSTDRLNRLYREFCGEVHLDVGVGTGYLLQKKFLPKNVQRIDLMDMNEDCLKRAHGVVSTYVDCKTIRHDVFKPARLDGKYDSVAAMYLFHCLPGKGFIEKKTAIDNLFGCVKAGGFFFGATILGKGVPINSMARDLLTKYNHLHVFTNWDDDADGLEEQLSQIGQLEYFEVEGCVALFAVKKQ